MGYIKTIKPKFSTDCAKCGCKVETTKLAAWEPGTGKVYHVKCYKTRTRFTPDKVPFCQDLN